MELTQLITHPEMMNKETLYDLRSFLALYPYHQTARLLMLKNLFILHDNTFDAELRRAAIYITDRRIIFNLVEASHYKIQKTETKAESLSAEKEKESRTLSLIATFLEARPNDVDEAETEKNKRKPAPADVAVDYVSYLMQLEEEESKARKSGPEMKGQNLIDNFINNEKGKIELKETPEYFPEIDESNGDENSGEENYFTETLARIYIKQGKYSQALEIIKRLNLNYPKKNAYFADQIRFIEKLIINNKNKNK